MRTYVDKGRGHQISTNVYIQIFLIEYLVHNLLIIVTRFFVSFIKIPVLLKISVLKKLYLGRGVDVKFWMFAGGEGRFKFWSSCENVIIESLLMCWSYKINLWNTKCSKWSCSYTKFTSSIKSKLSLSNKVKFFTSKQIKPLS